MELLKILLITAMISGCAHTLSEGALDNKPETELAGIPEFESSVSSGTLETIEPGYDTNYVQASLSINENYQVVGRNGCKALIINTNDKPILSVAQCDGDDEYIICADEPVECKIYFETKQNGSSLTLIKDWGWGHDKTRRVVEFHINKITYRIQGEDCLIGYPHGCIIDGFNWLDEEVYTYVY